MSDMTVTLQQICKINSGKSISSSNIEENKVTGLYPCFGGNGIRGYVSEPSHEGKYPIIGRVGAHCGNIHLADGKFYATEHALVVTITNNQVSHEWLCYALNKMNLSTIAKGVAQPVISASEVLKQSINIPPLCDQELIVRELDAIHGILDKKEEQLRELDNLAQAIFYDMFGDPITNPKQWEVKKLGEVGSFRRGGGFLKSDFVDSGFPCIHYGQIHTKFGPYIKSHLTEIPLSCVKDNRVARKNDVIIAITSEDIDGSCKSTAWLGDYDIAVGAHAAIYTHSQNAMYISYYTKTRAFYFEKSKYARGFKVMEIKPDDIAKIPIPLPPLSLQQSFAAKIEAIEAQKTAIRQSIREVEALLAERMDHYFN